MSKVVPRDDRSFQDRVQPWMMECFGPVISANKIERNHRFIEEALELAQAAGCSASEAHQLVDYVYSRPVGEKQQEVGGVMVTLAALCLANDLDMHEAAEVELVRIWAKVDQIRAKQAAKPAHSPLPAPPPATPVEVARNANAFDKPGGIFDSRDIELRLRESHPTPYAILKEAADYIARFRATVSQQAAEIERLKQTTDGLDAALMESARRWDASLPAQFVRKDGRRQTIAEIIKSADALESALAACRGERDAATVDAERLDWCERNKEPIWRSEGNDGGTCGCCFRPLPGPESWTTERVNPRPFPTIRAAIDAAIRASKEAETKELE